MRRFYAWLVVLFVGGSLAVATAQAGENIPISELPKPVVEALQARFPKAELLKAERETKRGRICFEVKLRHDGKRYEVDVSPEGKVLDVDRDDD